MQDQIYVVTDDKLVAKVHDITVWYINNGTPQQAF